LSQLEICYYLLTHSSMDHDNTVHSLGENVDALNLNGHDGASGFQENGNSSSLRGRARTRSSTIIAGDHDGGEQGLGDTEFSHGNGENEFGLDSETNGSSMNKTETTEPSAGLFSFVPLHVAC
jgi:hypothetical protein